MIIQKLLLRIIDEHKLLGCEFVIQIFQKAEIERQHGSSFSTRERIPLSLKTKGNDQLSTARTHTSE